ncbi:hypothetical protein [Caballeronia telluris]|uniref:hypothetical protein n=1 Tax=Caballeronia telluris TaxID=326475 RepID=UPI0038990BA6
MSKRIGAPEDTLRTTLLTRHHKVVEPTAAGCALLNPARRAFDIRKAQARPASRRAWVLLPAIK